MKCTRGNCAFISKKYDCNILQEETKTKPCPFFKTKAQYEAELKAVKARHKKIGMENEYEG